MGVCQGAASSGAGLTLQNITDSIHATLMNVNQQEQFNTNYDVSDAGAHTFHLNHDKKSTSLLKKRFGIKKGKPLFFVVDKSKKKKTFSPALISRANESKNYDHWEDSIIVNTSTYDDPVVPNCYLSNIPLLANFYVSYIAQKKKKKTAKAEREELLGILTSTLTNVRDMDQVRDPSLGKRKNNDNKGKSTAEEHGNKLVSSGLGSNDVVIQSTSCEKNIEESPQEQQDEDEKRQSSSSFDHLSLNHGVPYSSVTPETVFDSAKRFTMGDYLERKITQFKDPSIMKKIVHHTERKESEASFYQHERKSKNKTKKFNQQTETNFQQHHYNVNTNNNIDFSVKASHDSYNQDNKHDINNNNNDNTTIDHESGKYKEDKGKEDEGNDENGTYSLNVNVITVTEYAPTIFRALRALEGVTDEHFMNDFDLCDKWRDVLLRWCYRQLKRKASSLESQQKRQKGGSPTTTTNTTFSEPFAFNPSHEKDDFTHNNSKLFSNDIETSSLSSHLSTYIFPSEEEDAVENDSENSEESDEKENKRSLQQGEGRSQALFLKSKTMSYMCKTIAQNEVDVLLKLLPHYASYVYKHRQSMLMRFANLLKVQQLSLEIVVNITGRKSKKGGHKNVDSPQETIGSKHACEEHQHQDPVNEGGLGRDHSAQFTDGKKTNSDFPENKKKNQKENKSVFSRCTSDSPLTGKAVEDVANTIFSLFNIRIFSSEGGGSNDKNYHNAQDNNANEGNSYNKCKAKKNNHCKSEMSLTKNMMKSNAASIFSHGTKIEFPSGHTVRIPSDFTSHCNTNRDLHQGSFSSDNDDGYITLVSISRSKNEGFILGAGDIFKRCNILHERWDIKGRHPKPGKHWFIPKYHYDEEAFLIEIKACKKRSLQGGVEEAQDFYSFQKQGAEVSEGTQAFDGASTDIDERKEVEKTGAKLSSPSHSLRIEDTFPVVDEETKTKKYSEQKDTHDGDVFSLPKIYRPIPLAFEPPQNSARPSKSISNNEDNNTSSGEDSVIEDRLYPEVITRNNTQSYFSRLLDGLSLKQAMPIGSAIPLDGVRGSPTRITRSRRTSAIGMANVMSGLGTMREKKKVSHHYSYNAPNSPHKQHPNTSDRGRGMAAADHNSRMEAQDQYERNLLRSSFRQNSARRVEKLGSNQQEEENKGDQIKYLPDGLPIVFRSEGSPKPQSVTNEGFQKNHFCKDSPYKAKKIKNIKGNNKMNSNERDLCGHHILKHNKSSNKNDNSNRENLREFSNIINCPQYSHISSITDSRSRRDSTSNNTDAARADFDDRAPAEIGTNIRYVDSLKRLHLITRKDKDLVRLFWLEKDQRALLLNQLKSDLDFLRNNGLMDYSLLIGVRYNTPEQAIKLEVKKVKKTNKNAFLFHEGKQDSVQEEKSETDAGCNITMKVMMNPTGENNTSDPSARSSSRGPIVRREQNPHCNVKNTNIIINSNNKIKNDSHNREVSLTTKSTETSLTVSVCTEYTSIATVCSPTVTQQIARQRGLMRSKGNGGYGLKEAKSGNVDSIFSLYNTNVKNIVCKKEKVDGLLKHIPCPHFSSKCASLNSITGELAAGRDNRGEDHGITNKLRMKTLLGDETSKIAMEVRPVAKMMGPDGDSTLLRKLTRTSRMLKQNHHKKKKNDNEKNLRDYNSSDNKNSRDKGVSSDTAVKNEFLSFQQPLHVNNNNNNNNKERKNKNNVFEKKQNSKEKDQKHQPSLYKKLQVGKEVFDSRDHVVRCHFSSPERMDFARRDRQILYKKENFHLKENFDFRKPPSFPSLLRKSVNISLYQGGRTRIPSSELFLSSGRTEGGGIDNLKNVPASLLSSSANSSTGINSFEKFKRFASSDNTRFAKIHDYLEESCNDQLLLIYNSWIAAQNPRYTSIFQRGLESIGSVETYYIGIIDMLTPYNWKKKVSNFCKSFLWRPVTLSTIPPGAYRQRLEDYCQLIFPELYGWALGETEPEV